jgi:thymidylate synthase (FAD)
MEKKMKVIEQYYEIQMFSESPAQDIERAARTCYKSEDRITDESADKLVRNLVKRGHMAMIEFADAQVKFITNRGVSHEMVRHRICSFAQESTRYVNYKGGAVFIKPVWWDEWGNEDREIWTEDCVGSERRYLRLIERGNSPQKAREVLNNATKTEIVVKTNFTEWLHIFSQRDSYKAHPQMEALMSPVHEEFQKRCPAVFGNPED